jgi:hypothetical protein
MEFAVFPLELIKTEIINYQNKFGKMPKILVVAADDAVDYCLTFSMPKASVLGLEKIQRAKYLKSGEFELCQE